MYEWNDKPYVDRARVISLDNVMSLYISTSEGPRIGHIQANFLALSSSLFLCSPRSTRNTP